MLTNLHTRYGTEWQNEHEFYAFDINQLFLSISFSILPRNHTNQAMSYPKQDIYCWTTRFEILLLYNMISDYCYMYIKELNDFPIILDESFLLSPVQPMNTAPALCTTHKQDLYTVNETIFRLSNYTKSQCEQKLDKGHHS